jgi:hypothetical protein
MFDASFDFGCPAETCISLSSQQRRSRRGDDVVNVLVERGRRKRKTPSKVEYVLPTCEVESYC